MHISLISQNRASTSRKAVVFCCDSNFLPYASLAIYSLLLKIPTQDFDVCLVSLDELAIPDVLTSANIRNCHVTISDDNEALPLSDKISIAAYLRLMLPQFFAVDYDRIVYLDCDILVVGTEMEKLFKFDLHGAPLAAVMDSQKLKFPHRATPDQKIAHQNGPYFNSGVLVIDCKAYAAQGILEKCMEAFQKYAPNILAHDQTLLNLALKGNWAQLDNGWNWQWSAVRPMFEIYVDTQVVHFITRHKPWNDPKGTLPAQYRQFALRFLDKYFPGTQPHRAKEKKELVKRAFFVQLIKHLIRAPKFVHAYNVTGGDISKVIPPSEVRIP